MPESPLLHLTRFGVHKSNYLKEEFLNGVQIDAAGILSADRGY